MKDQRVYLKVKLKSLAAEARIIRLEESRNKHFRNGLSYHRRTVVRQEARLTLLAYGFVRGKAYEQIEKSERQPDWDRVKKMIEKYGVCEGGREARERQLAAFEAWKPQMTKAA
jgi:hypothetical protein